VALPFLWANAPKEIVTASKTKKGILLMVFRFGPPKYQKEKFPSYSKLFERLLRLPLLIV